MGVVDAVRSTRYIDESADAFLLDEGSGSIPSSSEE